jgi:hypothetical protein
LGSWGFQRAIHFQGDEKWLNGKGRNENSACREASEFAPRTPDTSSYIPLIKFGDDPAISLGVIALCFFQDGHLAAIFEVLSGRNLVER